MSIYTDNGYANRTVYLDAMSEDFGVERDTVEALACLLGEDEDFDGLIAALESADPEIY